MIRRVISTEPPTVEVTFEDTGHIMGVNSKGFGTYTAVVRPDGTLFGEGHGLNITQDGDMVSWKGTGLGKLGLDGSTSYRGMLFFQTASPKLAALNTTPGAFEYESSASGETHSKVWEWK